MTGYFLRQMEQRMQLEDLADSVALPRDSTGGGFLRSKFPSHLINGKTHGSPENFDFTLAVHFHFQYCPDRSGFHALLHFRSLLTGLPSIFLMSPSRSPARSDGDFL